MYPLGGVMKINKKEIFLLVILLSIFLFQSVVTLKNTNLAFDDPYSITMGYYFLKHMDTSMFVLHPPLSYILAGFPLLFMDIEMPYSYNECKDIGFYPCAQDMFFNSNNDPEKIGIYSRIPFIFISLLLGLLLFFFSKELYGTKAAFFSLALYVFSPTILGFNTHVFNDSLLTFFIFSTVYLLWKLLAQGYTRTRLILIGISVGLALASKFTAFLLFPTIILLFLIKIFQYKKNRTRILKKFTIKFILILLISFIVLYSTYFFSFGTIAESIPSRNVELIDHSIEDKFGKESLNYKLIDFFVHDLKIPMPECLAGVAGQFYMESTSGVKVTYLNGEIYSGGKWYYLFEVLLIKTPISLIIFFLIALFFLIKKGLRKFKSQFIVLLPILVFLGIHFTRSNYNNGLRYILPIVPFIFVFSSSILNMRLKKKRSDILFKTLISMLLIWYMLSAVFIMPNYMAYFNEFIGGPENGHNYLLGANLDQGQDLKKLNNYLKENNIGTIKLSYHGMFDPSYFNISYEPLPMEYYLPWAPEYRHPSYRPYEHPEDYKEDCLKKQGIIAISVTNLHNVFLFNKSCFNWLGDYEPIKKIGYTIHVYDITD